MSYNGFRLQFNSRLQEVLMSESEQADADSL